MKRWAANKKSKDEDHGMQAREKKELVRTAGKENGRKGNGGPAHAYAIHRERGDHVARAAGIDRALARSKKSHFASDALSFQY